MINRVVVFLCLCAGARRDALAQAPKARAQTATLGLLMILTAIVASLTSGYALSRAFLGDKYVFVVAVAGGAAWGCIVFCIDRLMILGLDKFATTGRLVAQVSMRVPLAVIIALVMSKPFILRLSEAVIDAELRQQQRETIGNEKVANAREANLNQIQKAVLDLKMARQQNEDRLRQEPDSHSYREAKAGLERAETRYREVLGMNRQRIARANSEINRIRTESVDGQLAAGAVSRIGVLRRQIELWQLEIGREQTALAAAHAKKSEAARDWERAEAENLARITGDLKDATVEENRATSAVNARNSEAEQAVARIMAPNLVNQYRTLRRVTADSKHPDAAAIRVFELGLDVLFLILELTPVLLKALARKGALDHATAAVEFVDQERINLRANAEVARLQKASEVAMAVEQEAIERWGDSLINGLQPGNVSSGDLRQLRQELAEMVA